MATHTVEKKQCEGSESEPFVQEQINNLKEIIKVDTALKQRILKRKGDVQKEEKKYSH